jgi:hypothetical protein
VGERENGRKRDDDGDGDTTVTRAHPPLRRQPNQPSGHDATGGGGGASAAALACAAQRHSECAECAAHGRVGFGHSDRRETFKSQAMHALRLVCFVSEVVSLRLIAAVESMRPVASCWVGFI